MRKCYTCGETHSNRDANYEPCPNERCAGKTIKIDRQLFKVVDLLAKIGYDIINADIVWNTRDSFGNHLIYIVIEFSREYNEMCFHNLPSGFTVKQTIQIPKRDMLVFRKLFGNDFDDETIRLAFKDTIKNLTNWVVNMSKDEKRLDKLRFMGYL